MHMSTALHRLASIGAGVLAAAFAAGPEWVGASAVVGPSAVGASAVVGPSAAVDPIEQLTEVMVEGREPRYVSPTRRDQIGRIWAPVIINGRGPFRLVLDTGASHSGVTSMVALALGLPMDESPPVILRGVTGFATVPTIKVDSLSVGDLSVDQSVLPIVPDALGGAEGVLGSEGLAGKRISVDFRKDRISIAFSKNERSGRGFVTIPFHPVRGTLVVIDAFIGHIRTKAIIDTGGQATIANLALKEALSRSNGYQAGQRDEIMGTTKEVQLGELIATPAIEIGDIKIVDSAVTFADLYIFKQWKMTGQPAILVGMDALGLLDTLIIDYRRQELQVRMARGAG
jgi:hypothetical protein